RRARGGGMRCLILYPMNALVRDQIDRMEQALSGQSKIRVFSLTSETPETEANRKRKAGYHPPEPHKGETREHARANPPEICITNYSMLEYMLVRPQDAPFFGPGLEMVVL